MQCTCCFRNDLEVFVVTCDACYRADPENSSQCKGCIDARRRVNNHLVCIRCEAPTKVRKTYKWAFSKGDIARAVNVVFQRKHGDTMSDMGNVVKFLLVGWVIDSLLIHLMNLPWIYAALHHACLLLLLVDLLRQSRNEFRRPFLEHVIEVYVIFHFFYLLIFAFYFTSLVLLQFLPFVAWTHMILPFLVHVLAMFHFFVLFFFLTLVYVFVKQSVKNIVATYNNCFLLQTRSFISPTTPDAAYYV